jgi:hypothetical protein
MFFLKILFDVLVGLVEIAASWKTNTHNLLIVAFMAPGIVSKPWMEPEMKIVPVKGAFYDFLKLLAYHKPGDAFLIVRIKGFGYR